MKRVGIRSKRKKSALADTGEFKDCPKLEANKYIELGKDKDGFEVNFINKYIGKGVFSTKQFKKGDFLMSYIGQLVSYDEIRRREKLYPLKLGSYLYFITWKGKKYGVDATFTDRICRFVNDGVGKQRNSVMVLETFNDRPHLCLYASRDICTGEEIRYDYGVQNLPWRHNINCSQSTRVIQSVKHCGDARKLINPKVTPCSVVIEKLTLQSIRKLGYDTVPINTSTIHTEDCYLGQPDNTVVHSDKTADKTGYTRVQSNVATVHPDDTVVQNGDTAFQHGDTAVLPDVTTVQLVDTVAQSGVAKPHPSNTAVQRKNAAFHPDETTFQPDEFTAQAVEAVAHSNETTYQSNNITVQPEKAAVLPNDTTVRPGETTNQTDDTAVQSGNLTYQSKNTTVQPEKTRVQLVAQPDVTKLQPSNQAVQTKNIAFQPDETIFQPDEFTAQAVKAVAHSDDSAYQSHNITVQPEKPAVLSDKTTVRPGKATIQTGDTAVQSGDTTDKPNATTAQRDNTAYQLESKLHNGLKRKTFTSKKSSQKDKPYRPCLYCSKPQSKLSLHLKRKHRDEDRVKAAMQLPKVLRDREFEKIRKEGIFAANRKIMLNKKMTNEEKKTKLLIERRQGTKDISVCSLCNGFFQTTTLYKHKRTCPGAEITTATPLALPLSVFGEVADSTDFRDNILRKFRRDNVGEICRTDSFIKLLGQHSFRKVTTRDEKKDELTETTMRDMRRFASLYVELKSSAEKDQKQISSSADVLKRENFRYLQEAIVTMTTKDDQTIKSGLKAGLGYLLKKATKVLKGHYLLQQQDDKAEEVDKFSTLLSYFWISIFGDAEYANVKARQTDLRRPKKLPLEEDIKKLRFYTMNKIETCLDPHLFFTKTEFKVLRDLLVCRLTLFNARRGGEPSRLLLQEWNDAETGEWISKSSIQSVSDPLEKQLIGKFKIAYQSGKNLNRMVPLLIPNDCLEGLRKLADMETRKNAGVNKANRFLFPNTMQSEKHIKGWHAVNGVCTLAGLSKAINATSMRHRASTIYAGLDIPENERQLFYQHMGHSEEMNRNVYQCPLALQEVTKVGRFLSNLDKTGSIATAGPSGEVVSVPEDVTNTNLSNPENNSSDEGDNSSDEGDNSADDHDYKQPDSNTDADNTDESSEEDELEDSEFCIKTTAVPTKGQRHIWTPETTCSVRTYFSSWIDDTSSFDRKGSLPGKQAIIGFLLKHPKILSDFDEKKRLSLMRTKLYNERNKSRNRVRKNLEGMWK